MKLWAIYALICPITREVKYIGITSCPLHQRLQSHMRGKDHNPKKFQWISWLHSQGLLPLIIPIDYVIGTRAQAEGKEREWIWEALRQGCTLFNINYIIGDPDEFAAFLRGYSYSSNDLSHNDEVSISA